MDETTTLNLSEIVKFECEPESTHVTLLHASGNKFAISKQLLWRTVEIASRREQDVLSQRVVTA